MSCGLQKYALMAMGMFAFLSCARENPCIDAFCWDVQTAGMAQEESDIKGETDLDGFLSEIERFPWYDQAVLAERNPTLSPTVSVIDLKTDRSVFGGVGRQPEGQLLGRLHLSRAETFSWNRPPLPPCGDVRNGTNGSDYSDREGFFRTRRSGVASAVGASVSVSAGERKRRLVGLYG